MGRRDALTERRRQWQRWAWSAAPFQRLAEATAEIHDELVRSLCPRAGEPWLDVATGTGAVALRAARAGADVTGVDLAPSMIATARQLAAAARLAVRFEVGDAEALSYQEASFDVVSSAQGVMFVLDHEAVADELARVCRPGGRLGLTALIPNRANEEFFDLWQRFLPAAAVHVPGPLDWGRESYVKRLLGSAFELEFSHCNAPLTGRSGEELWQLHSLCCGPIKLLTDSLPELHRAELRRGFVHFYERNRVGNRVIAPREYLLVIARRRRRARPRSP
jgi:SAM-dependent methyltransferase